MTRENWSSKRWGAGLLFLCLLSCHDAPRNNPFDPALTPPVELRVALDDTAGTATLTWTRYEGQQPFREYLVLRNIADRKSVDTLAHLPAVEQTAFVDTTLAPNTAYVYRVEVVNNSGHGFPSEEKSITGYAAAPVVLVEIEVDEAQGQAQLHWTRFQGGRFASYRVERRSGEEVVFRVIGRQVAVQDTAYVDEGVDPEVSYFYRVVVEAGGQEWPSVPSSRQGFSLTPVQLGSVGPAPGLEGLALSWRPFAGPDFTGYQVRRRVVGTDQEEVLAELSAAVDTSLVDSSAQAGVDYLYTLTVQAAGQELLSNAQVGRLVLPPVELMEPKFDSPTASANLRWRKYAGPRFKAYRVERRTAGLTPQVLKEIPDLADTSFADRGLVGNTEYFYGVVVVTERGEEVPSEEQSGAFHQLLATWPFSPENRSLVRLYAEGDQLAALLMPTNDYRYWLYILDLEGQVLDRQSPVSIITSGRLTQRSTATALNQAGQRFLSISEKGYRELNSQGSTGLMAFGPDQQPVMREHRLFESAFPDLLSGPEGRVLGEAALKGVNGRFGEVTVSTRGNLLFAEDFEDFPRGRLSGTTLGWDISGDVVAPGDGVFWSRGATHRTDATWQDFRLEAETAFTTPLYESEASVQIGGDTFSSFALTLSNGPQQIVLDWTFSPPAELGLEAKHQSFTTPFPILYNQPYRLGLEMVDGQLSASVRAPLVWVGANPSQAKWTSLAALGEYLAFTVYDQPYILTPEGEAIPLSPFETGVGEMRVWAGRRGSQLGVCLPEANKLLIGAIPVGQEADWPSFLANSIGPALGLPTEFLFHPLSFDVGPDGRIYVLDAGNARIVVFDSSRRYVTQWGSWGDGEGEFDFGRGALTSPGELDFAGSVAVDDQGYIYVCDEINGRIQKFAP